MLRPELRHGVRDFREGQIQAYPLALGHQQLRSSSYFFGGKLLKGETLMGGCK